MTKKNIKKYFFKGKKLRFYLVISLILLFIILFGTNAILYLNFLLGNDVVLTVLPNKEFFEVQRNDAFTVDFDISVTTNPFCLANCSYEFRDISSDKIIENIHSSKLTLVPEKISFPLNASWYGKGQKLYRLKAECKTQKAFLCHTDEIPTSKTVLISVNYDINKNDSFFKKEIKPKLLSFISEIELSLGKIKWMEYVLRNLNNITDIKDISNSVSKLNKSKIKIISQLENLKLIWADENYELLDKKSSEFEISLNNYLSDINDSEEKISDMILTYNKDISILEQIYDELMLYENLSQNNLTILNEVNDRIIAYNMVINLFSQNKLSIEKKNSVVEQLNLDMNFLRSYKTNMLLQISNLKLAILLTYNEICNQSQQFTIFSLDEYDNYCYNYNSSSNDFLEICNDVDLLYSFYDKFINNLTKINISNNTINKQNLTLEIDNILPDKCYLDNNSLGNNSFNLTKINSKKFELFSTNVSILSLELNVSFDEQKEECCVFGECKECCNIDSCNSKENYPVLFIHGHAFNKEVEADYSLEAFNILQSKLEEHGYLDAGSISLYTDQNFLKGNWGKTFYPISLKGSYYLDIFKEAEQYVLVQTKSENIDTYALRLKELIDTIKYRTGKDKVKIIAHSMGGLVSRKYLEVFGSDDVYSLLMIGTPNHGIEGTVADLCGLIGEDLECRDMTKNSLFLNKLNREDLPEIPIWIIIGKGCDMSGKDGDGIVLAESAYMDNTEIKYVNGTCKGFNKLHTELINPEKYPVVLDIVEKFLKE